MFTTRSWWIDMKWSTINYLTASRGNDVPLLFPVLGPLSILTSTWTLPYKRRRKKHINWYDLSDSELYIYVFSFFETQMVEKPLTKHMLSVISSTSSCSPGLRSRRQREQCQTNDLYHDTLEDLPSWWLLYPWLWPVSRFCPYRKCRVTHTETF